MPKIILSDEQVQVVREARSIVDVCDQQGRVLVRFDPDLTPERIASMKADLAAGPDYSGEEVGRRLQELQEAWEREGPFDRQRMFEILDDLRARNAP